MTATMTRTGSSTRSGSMTATMTGTGSATRRPPQSGTGTGTPAATLCPSASPWYGAGAARRLQSGVGRARFLHSSSSSSAARGGEGGGAGEERDDVDGEGEEEGGVQRWWSVVPQLGDISPAMESTSASPPTHGGRPHGGGVRRLQSWSWWSGYAWSSYWNSIPSAKIPAMTPNVAPGGAVLIMQLDGK